MENQTPILPKPKHRREYIFITVIFALIVATWFFIWQYSWLVEDTPILQVVLPSRHNKRNIDTEEEAEKIIKNRASETIRVIKNKEQEKFSDLIHPEKGVRFSSYSYINTKDNIVFSKNQILNFFQDKTIYTWGAHDGSGLPINLTPIEYYNKFIYDVDFVNPEEISYNRIIGKGNTTNNQFEAYPSSIIVEYYFSGFDLKYKGMDWKSLRLVFEEKDDVWYLVGIIHDQWTI